LGSAFHYKLEWIDGGHRHIAPKCTYTAVKPMMVIPAAAVGHCMGRKRHVAWLKASRSLAKEAASMSRLAPPRSPNEGSSTVAARSGRQRKLSGQESVEN